MRVKSLLVLGVKVSWGLQNILNSPFTANYILSVGLRVDIGVICFAGGQFGSTNDTLMKISGALLCTLWIPSTDLLSTLSGLNNRYSDRQKDIKFQKGCF